MSDGLPTLDSHELDALRGRIGHEHLHRRLALEGAQSAPPPGKRPPLLPRFVRTALVMSGLRARGHRNTTRFELRRRDVAVAALPAEFEGFTLLHLSDLHIDVDDAFAGHLVDFMRGVKADACVLTGDYRFGVHGSWAPVLRAMGRLRERLPDTVYAVLGNHDSVRMVPALEAMGIRVLLNESARIDKGAAALHVAGVDDPHFFRGHDIERAASAIPGGECSILLSHTPDTYREAARCGFGLMLCGHTHGGQVCLPGGIPVLTDSNAPRSFSRGAWRYKDMQGYTSAGCGSSIVAARFNCPPEVTLHRLTAIVRGR
jgi:predicted MPP superfamily phosphohydrolase